MGRQFEIAREFQVAQRPEEVWEAITTGIGGWLWPMEFEPKLGGAAAFGGTVTAWDPPHHLASRIEGDSGMVENGVPSGEPWFNQVEEVIRAADGGAWVRYVHSGIFGDDNWDNQYQGANLHTDFYLHTMREYLTHFSGRTVDYASGDAPASSNSPDGFEKLRTALGLAGDAEVGRPVSIDISGLDLAEAVLDYSDKYFVGLRTDNAMYRFFGRNAFGAPIGFAVHEFGTGTNADQAGKAWQSFLDGLYAN